MIVDICICSTYNPDILNLRYSILKNFTNQFIICTSLPDINFEISVNASVISSVDTIKNVIDIYSDDTIFMISEFDEIINPTFVGWIEYNILANQQDVYIANLTYLNKYINTEVYNIHTENPVAYQSIIFCSKSTLSTRSFDEIKNNQQHTKCLTYNNQYVLNMGWAFKNHTLSVNEITMACDINKLPKEINHYSNFSFANKWKTAIPIIATAVVNNSYWVTRLVASVDFPVNTFVIINNGGSEELCEELAHLKHLNKKFINEIKIVNLPGNIGCAGWWNLIIKCFLNNSHWIFVNDDVSFTPGLLQELYIKSFLPDIGIIYGANYYITCGHFDLFLIKDFVIEQYGLFDENFFPAYWEDIEYVMRINANGDKLPQIMSLNHQYYHGYTFDIRDSGHQTTVHLDRTVYENMKKTNMEYLVNKWGSDPNLASSPEYKKPFNNNDLELGHLLYDIKFNRTKTIDEIVRLSINKDTQ